MSNENVIIFTDDGSDENGLIENLNQWGYNTHYFSIKEPQISYENQIKPDLIIMDIRKGAEVEEIQLADEIIKKFDAALIYLLENCNETATEMARSTRPSYFIKKPFNDKELEFAVEMAVYRSKTEQKLKEEGDNFKILYNEAPIPYQSLDKNGYIVGVNDTWLEKLGYKREEVIGRWFGDFLTPEYVDHFMENFPKFKEAGKICNVSFEMLCAGGDRIRVSFDGKIGYDEDGNFKQTHCIFQDITEQEKAEKALKESEEYYKTIFENTGTATIIVEADTTISLVNHEFEKLYGKSKDNIEGKMTWTEFVSKKYIPIMVKYHETRRVNPEVVPRNYEFDLIDSNGNVKNILNTVAIIPGTQKSLVSLQDITEEKNAEKKLKSSLKDKELLLREIHHRVKNNLQIISSLLNLQSRYIMDEDALDVFTESQNRVKSMAIIHEKLYKSRNMSKIDFEEYITDLTDSLFYSYHVDPSQIQLNKSIEKIFFDVDTAIPCGLIINELITNCLKHAFPENITGEITIELYKNGDLFNLNVADTGVGFPIDVDFKNTESLGLQLVNNLVNQIDGTIELNSSLGTRFDIVFKELKYKNRV